MTGPPASAYRLVQRLARGELLWAVSGQEPDRGSWKLLRTALLELMQ